MRAADLQGRHPKAWKKTTVKGQKPVSAPDLVGRNFTAAAPNTAWCGDITYVRTWTGWAYLATVIDLHSRAAGSAGPSPTTCGPAWSSTPWTWPWRAAARRPESASTPTEELNIPAGNSTNTAVTTIFADPWDETGVCWDNAVAESFFATYKKELIHTRPWPTIDQLKTATFSWIETYYNRTRRHSALSYLTLWNTS